MSNINEPRFLHEFKDVWSDHLVRLRSLIVDGYWHIKENRLQFGIKTEDFTHTQKACEDVVESLEIFISKAEGERTKQGVQKFINETLSTVNIHLDRIKKYYPKNNPKGFKTKESKRDEGKFQRLVFKGEKDIKDNLKSLNIENDMSDFTVEFFNNEKATIPFKKILCSRFPNIAAKVETLNVDWDLVLDNEFFINKKRKDIPDWNTSKHFWDQEESVLQFWISEFNKIKNGLVVDGVVISPWLYYHMNFFKTPIGDEGDEILVPELRDNEWYLHEMIKYTQEQIDQGKDGGLAIMGTRRYGKALRNDEPLYYEDGERPIGDAKVGDKIYGADGQLTNITGVFPQGKVGLYKVSFGDGRDVISCDEHLWYVYDYQAKRYKTLPLKEIMNGGYSFERKRNWNGIDKISTIYNYWIPLTQPINYDKKKLDIDPYYLGVWLGDGTSNNTDITTMDIEMVDWLQNYCNKNNLILNKKDAKGKAFTYGLVTKAGKKNPLRTVMQNKQLLGNKHIPEEYFRVSIEQRLELLRGLMDTDGTIGKTGGNIAISLANKKLSEDTLKLCRTLGISCFIKEEQGNYVKQDGELNKFWTVNMFTDLPIFKLKRKLNRIDTTPNPSRKNRKHRTSITNIEYVGEDEATCIRVDNEDRLFLTRDYVVTHNSTGEASWSCFTMLTNPSKNGVISSSAEKDILALADKVDIGIVHLPPAFQLPINSKDWTKQVRFGLKTKSAQEIKYFYLDIVNIDSGNKRGSQKLAGISPILFVMDEFAKEKFIDAYNALIPALETTKGWKTIPWFTATGGDEDLSAEAEKALADPVGHRLVKMDWDILNRMVPEEHRTWEIRNFSFFIPAQMGQRTGHIKNKKSLSEFLGVESEQLSNIYIAVTDWENNTKVCKEKRKSLSRDRAQLQKEIVYYPLDPEECFMSAKSNPFDAQHAKKLKDRYIAKGNNVHGTATPIRLRREGDTVTYDLDTKADMATYPYSGGFVDSPGLLFGEFPKHKPPMWQFVAGFDDYKHEQSDGDSVSGFYIFDRISRRIVYSLATRPDPHKALHKEIHMALDAWNCKALPENEDMGIKEYLDRLHVTDSYLERKFDAFGDFSRFSTNRKYGWQPDKFTAPFVRNLVIDYTKEITEHQNDKGEVIDTEKGMDRVEDIHLLEEFIKYKEDGNFDRIVGFGSCLLYDYYLTSKRIFPRTNKRDREEVEEWKLKSTPQQRRAERRRKML